MYKMIGIAAAALVFMATTSPAAAQPKQPVKKEQSIKANEAANSLVFTENSEIDNIKRRVEMTANPGMLGFIMLMNEAGQPVYYGAVKGKITSGNKRLTEPDRVITANNGTAFGTNMVVRQAPSDEGTYGSSPDYIFWFSPDGQYMQWNGKYLYSDKPFRLRIEPLVINTGQ